MLESFLRRKLAYTTSSAPIRPANAAGGSAAASSAQAGRKEKEVLT